MEQDRNGIDGVAGTVNTDQVVTRKRRGRPRKDDNGPSGVSGENGDGVDGIIGAGESGGGNGDSGGNAAGDTGTGAGTGTGSGGGNTRRGRPAGKRGKREQEELSARIKGLTPIIAMGHSMLSNMLSQPALMLTQPDAELLAEAITECADAWGWTMSSDPRVMATFNLVLACGMIYGPRLQHIVKHQKPKLSVAQNESVAT